MIDVVRTRSSHRAGVAAGVPKRPSRRAGPTRALRAAAAGLLALLAAAVAAPSLAAARPACPDGVVATASQPMPHVAVVPQTQSCVTGTSQGYPLPDSHCTPGGINPTVTLSALQDPKFRTGCERDSASSAAQKAATYKTYALPHPTGNTGAGQTCELDHLISLELGGADSVDNIWPQCGPAGVALNKRYFKQKDQVENYLAAMVRAGKIDLATAQQGIATDWTQFLAAAQAWKPGASQ
jgi:hypothetical protein